MVIEEPEDPISIPSLAAAAEPEQYNTIGEFYDAIKAKITLFGDAIFTGAPSLQVTGVWPELIAIKDVATAGQAIDTIVRQGEGTPVTPLDPEGDPAHFYRFEQIVRQLTLVKDSTTPSGFAFGPPAIPFDPAGVYPMADDPAAAKLIPGSRAELLSNQFNYTYTSLLNALHQTFNGEPEHLDPAIGAMFSLRLQAIALMETPVSPASPETAGPAWEYKPVV
ncbi:MAG: ferritin-like family protein [Acidobacteria bacterium]|nr:ferritin-like family protein [Acidobacteriota bacterium]